MNRQLLLVIAVAATVGLAGCGALSGGDDPTATPTEGVQMENPDAGATSVNHTLRMTVDADTAGEEWTEIGGTYPRDAFTVSAAQHEELVLGVDEDGDGDLERTFDESNVSGANNNAYSYTITLDTDYTLSEGDVVVVGYPAVDNPDDPGEYDVELRLNDRQTENATVAIE